MPINRVANADERHVAVITAPASMPVVASTAGWTKMMYDKVTNVVTPPMISARSSAPCQLSDRAISAQAPGTACSDQIHAA